MRERFTHSTSRTNIWSHVNFCSNRDEHSNYSIHFGTNGDTECYYATCADKISNLDTQTNENKGTDTDKAPYGNANANYNAKAADAFAI